MARTDSLPNFLTDVADAIREKKGTEETIQASDFDTEIANLPSGGGGVSDYFYTTIYNDPRAAGEDLRTQCLKKIPTLTIDNSVTTLNSGLSRGKFEELEGLIFNDNVTDIGGLFNTCQKLKKVNLNDCDVSKVTTMQQTFYYCDNLEELDLKNWSTPSLKNVYQMFSYDKKLKYLDIRNMTFDNVTSDTRMFGSSSSDGPANDCLIIVKSQTEKDWITSKFSRLTNVKTVAEYEAE